MAMRDPLLLNPQASQARAPAKRLVVYTIIDKPGTDKSFWQRIGSAWVNRDQSINIQLDAFPVNGKLHVREPSERPEGSKPGEP
ncbi:MAG: hypothetical protein ACYCWW_05940 [Deltaproteobacteria bacterium]